MGERNLLTRALPALILAGGIAAGGWFVGNGFFRARSVDRYVTVKGLAEREVAANMVIWPVVFAETADDLVELQRRVDASAAKVSTWLSTGFDPGEISVSAPRVTDRQAQGYNSPGQRLERYVAEATVTLRTGKIDRVKEFIPRSGELISQGVALIRSYEYNTQYLYTDLDKIKPEMIAEATRDARGAAEQFARDSLSTVGAIRNAQQGYFSIEDRDQFSPEFKKIRVVTNIQYFLVDE